VEFKLSALIVASTSSPLSQCPFAISTVTHSPFPVALAKGIPEIPADSADRIIIMLKTRLCPRRGLSAVACALDFIGFASKQWYLKEAPDKAYSQYFV